jgi:hypothetical protein
VVRTPAGTRDFLISKTIWTISRAHPASYSMGTGVLPWGNGKYKATYDKLINYNFREVSKLTSLAL